MDSSRRHRDAGRLLGTLKLRSPLPDYSLTKFLQQAFPVWEAYNALAYVWSERANPRLHEPPPAHSSSPTSTPPNALPSTTTNARRS